MPKELQKIKVAFNSMNGWMLPRQSPKKNFVDHWGPNSQYVQIPVTWKDNFVFNATFAIEGTDEGRSLTTVRVRDMATQQRYNIKLRDFMAAISKRDIINNCIQGDWCFHRAGGVASVILYDP